MSHVVFQEVGQDSQCMIRQETILALARPCQMMLAHVEPAPVLATLVPWSVLLMMHYLHMHIMHCGTALLALLFVC